MRYRFSFFFDARRRIETGRFTIKTNLYDNTLKIQKIFGIANVILNDGTAIELSRKDRDEFDDLSTNKDRKNSFGEVVGETTVHGRKLEIRPILKAKQDILKQIVTDSAMTELSDIKSAFQNYVPKKIFNDGILEAFDSCFIKQNSKGSYKTAKVYITTSINLFKYLNPNKTKEQIVARDGRVLSFFDITIDWLEIYERIRLKNVSKSTVGIELRNLRTIFNEAILRLGLI